MAEAAITLPVVLLAALLLINGAMAGFAAVNAANAANVGARMGSVTQGNAAAAATAAAWQALSHAPVGEYRVRAFGGGAPGVPIVVQVDWEVPSFLGGLMSLFGRSGPQKFSGTATAVFRGEGW